MLPLLLQLLLELLLQLLLQTLYLVLQFQQCIWLLMAAPVFLGLT